MTAAWFIYRVISLFGFAIKKRLREHKRKKSLVKYLPDLVRF